MYIGNAFYLTQGAWNRILRYGILDVNKNAHVGVVFVFVVSVVAMPLWYIGVIVSEQGGAR